MTNTEKDCSTPSCGRCPYWGKEGHHFAVVWRGRWADLLRCACGHTVEETR
jgi:hypothetical protein